MINGSWDLRYEVQRTKFFVILGHFLSFDPSNNTKNQNFEKIKKTGDIIILHRSTINKNHMCDSWDMERNRIFSHFGPFFALLPLSPPPPPAPPLTTQRIKILKKQNKTLWRSLLVATSKFSLLTIRWHSATRKHLFLYPQGDRSGLRKPKKNNRSYHQHSSP